MSQKKIEVSILPDIEEKLKKYATNLENFSIYEYEKCQIHWERKANPLELLYFEESPLCSTLKVQRDPFTGEIQDFHEVRLQSAGATAQNSMLLNRAPIAPSQEARGGTTCLPFWPGTFPSDALNIPSYEEFPTSELLTIPPGFSSGLTFDSDGVTVLEKKDIGARSEKLPEQKHVINLLELAQNEQNFLGTWGTPKNEPKDDSEKHIEQPYTEEEAIIPKEPLVLNISNTAPTNTYTRQWAVELDATKHVKDFEKKVPDMACKFKFKLDPFQELAIIHLEKHNHVLVTAHTSAGKTAVAEYAIALSQKHLTKTIYTSPIKALSNQKYRDFKMKFQDVGLLTGDIQLNEATARCLVMTTEILRSQLYTGHNIIRDLEYVIFDEVHYINDRERGHVWEQVLIMLPRDVTIVMLSASIPNPSEFANWLGGIHQKKVYVIPTAKRPVPLQHFLYTGTDTKTKKNMFQILNDSEWSMEGYFRAKNSIPDQSDKRGNDRRQFTEKQDKTLWVALISHLKSENLLPAVAFTFSRAKCDRNASNIPLSIDLIDRKADKSLIHKFYNRCISHLREEDRKIQQVQIMKDLLSRGIGVHHSGILPIIKEIVEMLFQEGLIKLLFATETFAMGVNMPARTVVFDSIKKYDGKECRHLEAAEYIQMAGRAGRRSFDKTGTVIILCKNQLPVELTLKQMMMGRPKPLKSQFRLTYGMVLSLLQVRFLTVEDMMKRSFLEVDNQGVLDVKKKELAHVEEEISKLCKDELSSYLQPLVEYFDSAHKYLSIRSEILPKLFLNAKLVKVLVPGSVLLICWKEHINQLAMLLSVVKAGELYKVFILSDKDAQTCNLDSETDMWYKMVSLASDKVYCPTDIVSHNVVDISPTDVLEITGKVIKLNTELIFRDWSNRQLPRFKHEPPGQTTSKAAQELHKLSLSSRSADAEALEYLHLICDLHVNDNDLYMELMDLYSLKVDMQKHLPSTQIPNFLEQFSIVYKKKYLEKKRDAMEASIEASQLFHDLENRKKLLKSLEYVDDKDRVQLKGRVACKIGMNELLITELVLRKVLLDLKPAEVAALLSTLVFQVKSKNEDQSDVELLKRLTPDLQKAIEKLKRIHEEILNLESSMNIEREDIPEKLNLEVVEIIYDWASKKSFAEVMQGTHHQEGIIVRCIQQLKDTIDDVRDAAKIIGNPLLITKMKEAATAIEGNIVFVQSLYTKDSLSEILSAK